MAPNRLIRQGAVRGAMGGIGQAPQRGRRADLAHRKPGQAFAQRSEGVSFVGPWIATDRLFDFICIRSIASSAHVIAQGDSNLPVISQNALGRQTIMDHLNMAFDANSVPLSMATATGRPWAGPCPTRWDMRVFKSCPCIQKTDASLHEGALVFVAWRMSAFPAEARRTRSAGLVTGRLNAIRSNQHQLSDRNRR